MFNKKKFMTGAYSLGIAAVAVAAVILVNCLAAMLPSYITKPDVTPEKLATVGADSKKILEKVDTDITIYRIYSDSYVNASTGQAAAVDTNVKNLLDKYKDACSRITLKEVDPAKDPTFLDKYTKATLGQNSLVVESEKRSICVDINDMYRFEIVGYYDGEYLSAEEVNYAYQSIYENYYDMPEVKQYFFGENSITGAIDYVISDKIPVIYELTGHGEQPLSGYAFGKITVQENIELRELNLASGAAGTVPEDCEAVMIYTPTADLTKAESDALISYVDAGGVIMLYTFGELVSAEKMPNLAALTSHMGLEAIPGFICDNDANHYFEETPLYLIPTLTGEGISAPVAGNTRLNFYAPFSHGIRTVEGAKDVTCLPLVNTSKSGYIFNEETKEAPDKEEMQTYSLAYQSTSAGGGTLYWFASPDFISDAFTDYANGELYIEMLTKTCDKPVSVSIIGKTLSQVVVQRTEAMTFLANLLLIGVIPLIAVVAGFVAWYLRRRK